MCALRVNFLFRETDDQALHAAMAQVPKRKRADYARALMVRGYAVLARDGKDGHVALLGETVWRRETVAAEAQLRTPAATIPAAEPLAAADPLTAPFEAIDAILAGTEAMVLSR